MADFEDGVNTAVDLYTSQQQNSYDLGLLS